jgi:hypothetical protein
MQDRQLDPLVVACIFHGPFESKGIILLTSVQSDLGTCIEIILVNTTEISPLNINEDRDWCALALLSNGTHIQAAEPCNARNHTYWRSQHFMVMNGLYTTVQAFQHWNLITLSTHHGPNAANHRHSRIASAEWMAGDSLHLSSN